MSDRTDHIAQNKKILDLASKLQIPSAKAPAEVWYVLSSKLTGPTKLVKIHVWMRVAASISVIYITFYLLYQAFDVTVVTHGAQRKEVALPDHSKVLLNVESALHYNQLSWMLSRSLKFEGEGYFEVAKGSVFTVNSSNGTTQVLGTSFNIYSRDEDYRVSCSSGRVQVDMPSRSQQILTAGLSTNNLGESTITKPFKESHVFGWKRGEFYFESQPLSSVFTTIERQYNVKISSPKIDLTRRYTGFFTNKDIDEALKVVCLPMGISYKIIDTNNIRIY